MGMQRIQIEQAASDFAQACELTSNRSEIDIAYTSFLAGAEYAKSALRRAAWDAFCGSQCGGDGLTDKCREARTQCGQRGLFIRKYTEMTEK